MRKLQDHPPQQCDPCCVQESAPQAAARVNAFFSKAKTIQTKPKEET